MNDRDEMNRYDIKRIIAGLNTAATYAESFARRAITPHKIAAKCKRDAAFWRFYVHQLQHALDRHRKNRRIEL